MAQAAAYREEQQRLIDQAAASVSTKTTVNSPGATYVPGQYIGPTGPDNAVVDSSAPAITVETPPPGSDNKKPSALLLLLATAAAFYMFGG
jgi:hypothetical protein